MWPFDIKKRRAAAKAEAERQERIRLSWSAPACEALLLDGKKLVVSEKIGTSGGVATVRVVPVAGSQDKSGFQSTAASKWSTAEWKQRTLEQKDGLILPVRLERTASGSIVGVRIDNYAIRHDKELLQHWRWLLKNPKLALFQFQRTRRHTERLRDSALFI